MPPVAQRPNYSKEFRIRSALAQVRRSLPFTIPPDLEKPFLETARRLTESVYDRFAFFQNQRPFKPKNPDFDQFENYLTAIFQPIFKRLVYPERRRAGFDPRRHFSTCLYGYIPNLSGLIRELIGKQLVNVGGLEAEEKLLKLLDKPQVTKEELLSRLKPSPLYRFFYSRMPLFPIPLTSRFEHTYVLAKTGHGKTQLLLHLIYDDLLRAQRGRGGFGVIDSQGDLIDLIIRLKIFDPRLKGSLADKLVLVDPNDVEFPVSLNVFDINQERLKTIKDPAIREMTYNFAIALYGYIFSHLVEGKLTMYQQNIFEYCAKLMFVIPGATILTLIDFLEHSDRYKPYIKNLDEMTQRPPLLELSRHPSCSKGVPTRPILQGGCLGHRRGYFYFIRPAKSVNGCRGKL
jgi:hypothetical protein